MNEQNNIEIVRAAYQNFKSGDINTLLGQMSDDVNWDFLDIENVPFAGKRSGIESVAQFFSILGDSQEALEFNPQEFIPQGEKVVVLGNFRWRVKSTGNEYGGDWAHVFTLRDGKIVKFKEYMDTAAASRAYQKAQAV